MHRIPAKDSIDQTIYWLMDGDVSIQYQTLRDLLNDNCAKLQARIEREGWGKEYLDHRNPDGSWGLGFYQPKWTSSHYTLLELKSLAISPDQPLVRESISNIASRYKAEDGRIGHARGVKTSDVCINGMFLNYACYFKTPEEPLESVVDFLLEQCMDDGGFNCRKNRSGAHHSSLHSTLSVLEGILEYSKNGYTYRLDELLDTAGRSREFILIHHLFKSDRTGEVIRKDFLQLSYPPRWRYNILKALDYFRASDTPFDPRMNDAIEALIARRRADGLWPGYAAHRGKVFFVMEPPRRPSRWNTLLALQVLRAYGANCTIADEE